MPRSLFRKEAIDAQRQKFLGEASIAHPVRGWVYTTVAVIAAVAVIAVAVWGQYTRRERVQGFLSSAAGAAILRMPDAGTITELMVREGDVVKAGTPLAQLTVDKSGKNDVAGNEAVIGELNKQADSQRQQRDDTVRLGRQQLEQLKGGIASFRDEIREADVEVKLQNERLAQARQLLDKWLDLKAKDYASEFYVLQYQNQVKDQEIRVQSLLRQRASLMKDLAAAEADVPATQLRAQSQVDQINQKVSSTEQAIAEQQAQHERSVKREMVIVAPIDGTVTNIGPSLGQTVAADTQFATVLPKDGGLHAELLVPTRAIGFVHAGEAVTLRYDAFPYERFGQFRGRVESVGRTPLLNGESIGPLTVHEPVYRLVVALDRQDVDAGGQALPLRAGMVASADLLMERRTLLEWLFQPVIQLRERMRGATVATR